MGKVINLVEFRNKNTKKGDSIDFKKVMKDNKEKEEKLKKERETNNKQVTKNYNLK